MNKGDQTAASAKSLEERLRFETLLFDLSARFLAIPFDQVDAEIHHALTRILEFLQVDRCALLEFREDKGLARISHAAWGEGIAPISGDINLAELFPWCYGQLKRGKHINISRLEDYPEDALIDRQSQVAMSIKSALNIPVAVGGRSRGRVRTMDKLVDLLDRAAGGNAVGRRRLQRPGEAH